MSKTHPLMRAKVSIKKVFVAILMVACAPLVFPALYFLLGGVSFLQGANLATDDSAVQTVYVFNFADGKCVRIRDDHNKIVRSWGGSPDAVAVENGVRTVRFSGSAILKTGVDSIAPHHDYVKMKGHLGFYTDDTEFVVGQDGGISSAAWVREPASAGVCRPRTPRKAAIGPI